MACVEAMATRARITQRNVMVDGQLGQLGDFFFFFEEEFITETKRKKKVSNSTSITGTWENYGFIVL